MELNIVYEIIGYVASVLIAVSLMMKAIIKLRVINLIGAATFSVYGMLIGSIPVAAMNGFIVLINIYFLYQMFTAKEYFKLIQLYPNSKMLRHFLDFYADDIAKFVPDYSYQDTEETFALFVLRDMVPAGLLLGKKTDDGSLILELDYVIPNYRDFKIGRYIYDKKRDFLSDRGIKRIICKSNQPVHMKYLKKMGFEKSGSEFELKL